MGHSFQSAISQMAQTTLRSVIGQSHLDDLLAQRDKINDRFGKFWTSKSEFEQPQLPPLKILKGKRWMVVSYKRV